MTSECRNGHPYTTDNTRIGYDGTRVCRRCRYNRVKRYRANKRAKLLNASAA